MMANPHEDKFALLLKELDSGCDWVFWSDAGVFCLLIDRALE